MNILKRTLLITVLALVSVCLNAQWYRDRIAENPDRAGGIYHSYEYVSTPLTKAPKGYRPFYISHYGRHGSRYHLNPKNMESAVHILDSARTEGLLTEEGELISRQMDTVFAEHDGMYGMLTSRGAGEHRGIASRMFDNYEDVFKGRHEVACVASTAPRCIISMANFATALADRANDEDIDDLRFSYVTGSKYLDYLAKGVGSSEGDREFRGRMVDSLRRAGINPDRLFGVIFKDPSQASKSIKDPISFLNGIYMTGCISEDTDAKPDIFSHFTIDELVAFWIPESDGFYFSSGISREVGDYYSKIAKPLIKDFVAKADEALSEGSDRAADLRFGHDTGIVPFLGTIGIKGMDKRLKSSEAHQKWATFEFIPMGSNFQMIFFRNMSGDVIVKMLYNEKETTIPAVRAWKGPYYKWKDLRAYLANLADSISDDTKDPL